jgi:hypothetical protein
MKAIKIYLIVVSFMLLAALSMGVYVWYTYQTLQADASEDSGRETSKTP